MRYLLGAASALWMAATGYAAEPVKAPPEVQALLPALRSQTGPTAVPIFWQRTVDYRDETAPAWLLGCGDGRSRTAQWVMLVDNAGRVIVRAPPAPEGCDGGFVVRLSPETYALTLTSPSGRRVSSTVQVYVLGGEALTLAFACESPASPLWNSTIYFADYDADGTLDLLIDREVNLDGARTRERLLYRYDSRRRNFRETIAVPTRVAAAIAAAAADPLTPRAVQYTLPYLTGVVH